MSSVIRSQEEKVITQTKSKNRANRQAKKLAGRGGRSIDPTGWVANAMHGLDSRCGVAMGSAGSIGEEKVERHAPRPAWASSPPPPPDAITTRRRRNLDRCNRKSRFNNKFEPGAAIPRRARRRVPAARRRDLATPSLVYGHAGASWMTPLSCGGCWSIRDGWTSPRPALVVLLIPHPRRGLVA
jgi:hypothetical protein